MTDSTRAVAARPGASIHRSRSAATALRARGFWPIPLYPPGHVAEEGKAPEKGKRPIGLKWGEKRISLEELNAKFRSFPDANVGVALGPGRGPENTWLADFEGDGDRAEDSFLELTGGEDPETLSFGSTRGKHRLFSVDGPRLLALLTKCKATECKGSKAGVWKLPQLPDLEMRIGGTKDDGAVKQLQSVVPPSASFTEAGELAPERTWDHGADAPLAALPESAYQSLERIAEAVAQRAAKPAADEPRPDLRSKPRSSDGSLLERRVKPYIDEIEGAVSGSRGHDKTYGAVCRVALGFGLTEDQAFEAIKLYYNPKCDPAWSDEEIHHKIQSAYENCKQTPGWLLNTPSKNGKAKLNGHHNGNGYHEGNGQAVGNEEQLPPLVPIKISRFEHEVADEAIFALRQEPNLFQRGNGLVQVIEEVKPKPTKQGVGRPSGTLRIMPLPKHQVRRLITKYVSFYKEVKGEEVPANIPSYLADMVATMGVYPPCIRPLEGIIESPALRQNGSLIDRPGYDAETGLWFEPGADFPAIPAKPSREDAARAANLLFDLVSDFPFAVTEIDRPDDEPERIQASKAAWMASLLTPLARFMIDGPTPLFLIDANTPGTGKSKLCDIIAIITTGREMARGAYPDNDEEMQKMMLSVVMADDRLLLFDNVATGFSIGGSALDRAITARTMKGRILGKSQMTAELPMNTVLYATGNNLGIRGDGLRRVVPIPLETAEERPEERQDFKIEGDILRHVKEHRGKFVAAALTILRGYIEAGQPDRKLTPMDFAAWSGLVRNAVHWATGIDPCLTRKALIANDEETNQRKVVITGFEALCTALEQSKGMTLAAVLHAMENPPTGTQELREVLVSWSRDGKLPSPKALSSKLKAIKGRNCQGKILRCGLTEGINRWYVQTLPGVSGGFGGFENPSV